MKFKDAKMTTKEIIKNLFSTNYGKVSSAELMKILISTSYGKNQF